MSYESRFWSKVDKNGECWEWTAAKTKGYGVLRVDHSNVYAHRIAWQLENGAIPNGMVVMHKCDNPGCVRHTHLRVGTQAENILDMKLKGRDNDDNFWYAKRTISNEIVSQIQEIGF